MEGVLLWRHAPFKGLIAAGAGADILIHEATVGANDVAEARTKGHSTVCEALKVGARMNSKVTVLTHFSQRWQRPPLDEFYDACRASGLLPGEVGTVVLADDFMKVSVNEAATRTWADSNGSSTRATWLRLRAIMLSNARQANRTTAMIWMTMTTLIATVGAEEQQRSRSRPYFSQTSCAIINEGCSRCCHSTACGISSWAFSSIVLYK